MRKRITAMLSTRCSAANWTFKKHWGHCNINYTMDKLSFYMRNSIHWIGITLVAFFFSLESCGDGKPAQQQAPPPTSVAVYTAQTGNATYFDSYPATVTPLNQ